MTIQERIHGILEGGAVLEVGKDGTEGFFLVGDLALSDGLIVWGDPFFPPDPFFSEFNFHSAPIAGANDDGEEITFRVTADIGTTEFRLIPIELSIRFGGDDLEKTKRGIKNFREKLRNGYFPKWKEFFDNAAKSSEKEPSPVV
jgi:hypothetical protein